MILTEQQQRAWGSGTPLKEIITPPPATPKISEFERAVNYLISTGELYTELLKSDFITNDFKLFKYLLTLANDPIVLIDFDNSLNSFKSLPLVIDYDAQYYKKCINSLVERRLERGRNKAQRVYIFCNSLQDFKIDYNYLHKRGTAAGVYLIGYGTPPKKAVFTNSYINGILMLDGVPLQVKLKDPPKIQYQNIRVNV